MRQTPASERVECSRCGSFVPASDLDRHGVCDDCVSRLSELQRLPPTVPNVVMGALGLLVKLALPALLLAAATSLPRYFLERHGGMWIPMAGWALDVLAQGVLLYMAQRVILERPTELVRSVQVTTDHFLRLLVVAFLSGLQIWLLFIAPSFVSIPIVIAAPDTAVVMPLIGLVVGLGLALWRASSLAIALPIALHEDRSGLDALRASAHRMKKHRLPAFLFALAGLAWMVVPILQMLVGMVTSLVAGFAGIAGDVGAIHPATAETLATRLDELGPAIEIGSLVLSALAMLTMTSLSAVLYTKTVTHRVY